MEKTMKILRIEKKSQILNTYERFHTYNVSKQNIQLNDTFTETYNPIYDTILSNFPIKKKLPLGPLHTLTIAHYQSSPCSILPNLQTTQDYTLAP
jgi:hypothetical protein